MPGRESSSSSEAELMSIRNAGADLALVAGGSIFWALLFARAPAANKVDMRTNPQRIFLVS
jgi:hypothetical protein